MPVSIVAFTEPRFSISVAIRTAAAGLIPVMTLTYSCDGAGRHVEAADAAFLLHHVVDLADLLLALRGRELGLAAGCR